MGNDLGAFAAACLLVSVDAARSVRGQVSDWRRQVRTRSLSSGPHPYTLVSPHRGGTPLLAIPKFNNIVIFPAAASMPATQRRRLLLKLCVVSCGACTA